MKYRDYLEKVLGENISRKIRLPRGYHVIGHVILLDLDSSAKPFTEQIAQTTLQFEPRGKTVMVKTGPTKGKIREPTYKYVVGDPETETVHLEAGVRYKLDPAKVTFSGGNRAERIRMPKLIQKEETVIDMFSCVGQFAIAIAKRAKANVIAIEINPTAFQYLKQNIILNKISDYVIPVLGDCLKVTPTKVADRVIMGYLHNTIEYLPTAIDALKENGGWIHMHQSWSILEPIKNLKNKIQKICGDRFTCKYRFRKIKEYAPGVIHLVADIKLSKA